MIDLCITGSLGEDEKDIFEFTVDNNTKTIDQFNKSATFSIDTPQTCRIYFEQKRAEYIPRNMETVLNLLFLPIRGLLNIITFNAESNWECEVTGFRVSGYMDINLEKDITITFEYKKDFFDKLSNTFFKPKMCFDAEFNAVQTIIPDDNEIRKSHSEFVQKIISVSIWFYVLFAFLLVQSIKYSRHIALIIISSIIMVISIIITLIIIKSFKKKRQLIRILSKQSAINKI